jgi:large subunit ribosomal protein L4
MKLEVYNLENKKVGEVEVSDEVFGTDVKPHLHHEVVRWQLAKKRAGTHDTLTKGEVNRSTKKLGKQKGGGGARHGSRKANLFTGGGVIHGPHPRGHEFKLTRKTRRAALRSALSEKALAGRLKVVDRWEMAAPKTKLAATSLTTLGVSKALVVDQANDPLQLSIRNLPRSKFLRSEGINVRDVLHHDFVVITEAAIRAIDGVLKS